MPETTLRVVARVLALPGKVEELRAVLTSLIEPTRREPGCIAYELLHNRHDPNDFTFLETWVDEDALDEHLASEHFQAAAEKLRTLVAAEPDVQRYTVVG